jgi:hypothetical protein
MKIIFRKIIISSFVSAALILFFYFFDNMVNGAELFFFSYALYFTNLISSFIALFIIIYYFISKKININISIFIAFFSLATFIAQLFVFGFKGGVLYYQITAQSFFIFVFLSILLMIDYKRRYKAAKSIQE